MTELDKKLDSSIGALRTMVLIATFAAFGLATFGAFKSGTSGTVAAGLAVAIVVATPLLRVIIVGAHWWRIGDRRFTAVAGVLLTVVGLGAIVAFL